MIADPAAGGPAPGPPTEAGEPSFSDVLDLEAIDRDLYRSRLVYPDRYALYGGQVAAQALLAAGRTVGEERLPHSLHCSFLRAGDAARPTVFRVDRDRDGRSFSARRVVALQGGEVLASVSCSFSVAQEGPDLSVAEPPPAAGPVGLPAYLLPRLFSFESRLPEQPYPESTWPLRFWARATTALPDDPLVHACALTYLSDISTGVTAFEGGAELTSTSLDHAVWFHRGLRLDDWVLTDLQPVTLAASRGWYTGTVHDSAGRLGASLTQEVLARRQRRRAP